MFGSSGQQNNHLKEPSMSDLRVNIGREFSPEAGKTYIGLIGIDRIPFHLVTVSDQKQFSWEVGKMRLSEPVEGLLRHLKLRNTPSLFLEISGSENLVDEIESAYSRYTEYETCIGPINAFVSLGVIKLSAEPLTIFELIDQLEPQGSINGYFGLNTSQDEVQLNRYGRKEVEEYVGNLHQKLTSANG